MRFYNIFLILVGLFFNQNLLIMKPQTVTILITVIAGLLIFCMYVNLFSQTLSINQTVNDDTDIYPFENINLSYGLKLIGHIQLNSGPVL